MHQAKYAIDLLKKFNMFDCNSILTPTEIGLVLEKEGTEELINPTYFRHIIGSLRYLCSTRPDLGFSVGLIRKFMETPRVLHLLAAKIIMHYVKRTMDYGIVFTKGSDNSKVELLGYFDSDWCCNKSD